MQPTIHACKAHNINILLVLLLTVGNHFIKTITSLIFAPFFTKLKLCKCVTMGAALRCTSKEPDSPPVLPIEDRHDYYMAMCVVSSLRSKDPCTKVGACTVDPQGNFVGCGYNGMPRGCPDDKFPWCKSRDAELGPLYNKHLYVCHAELNAIVNSMGSLDNCVIYVTLFPCNECAKLIIQAGIKEVIYLSDKHAKKPGTIAAKLMFKSAEVKYWRYEPRSKIHLKFADLYPKKFALDENEEIIDLRRLFS